MPTALMDRPVVALPALPAPDAVPGHPRVRAVLRHVGLTLLTATVVPGVLFYVCLVTLGLWAALAAALLWCYGVIGWRLMSGRRVSGLLGLTVVGLTARTAFTLATGDPTLYLLQPAFTSVLVGAGFLVSMTTTSPAVARLAADFYPMTAALSDRPPMGRLFQRLTLLWGMVCLVKGAATAWLVLTLSVPDVVLAKTLAFPALTACAVGVTVLAAVKVMRAEGLLPCRRPAMPAALATGDRGRG
jgi:hypothetical protein